MAQQVGRSLGQTAFSQKNCDTGCFWAALAADFHTVALVSLSLMDSRGKGQQNSRELPLVTEDNSLCPMSQLLGGLEASIWNIWGSLHTSTPLNLLSYTSEVLPSKPFQLCQGDWKFLLSSWVWLDFHFAWQGTGEGPSCSAPEQALHS